MRQILVKRIAHARIHHFRRIRASPRGVSGINELVGCDEGKIKYREDIVEGLENAPSAFLGLLAGRNFGKLVGRVSPDAGAARIRRRSTLLCGCRKWQEADRLTVAAGMPGDDLMHNAGSAVAREVMAALVGSARRRPLRAGQ